MAPLGYSKQTKMFSLSTPTCRIRRWRLALEVDGGELSCGELRLRDYTELPDGATVTLVSERGLSWRLDFSAEERDGEAEVTINTVLTNAGDRAVSLGKVWLLQSHDGASLGARTDEILCLPLSGELTPRRVYRLHDPDCPPESRIKTQFASIRAPGKAADAAESRRPSAALQVGFDTFKRCNTVVRHQVSGSGSIAELEAYCDFAGWELGPGESTRTETFHLSSGLDPYLQLERWADRAAAANGARSWEDPPIGWLGWAWVDPFTVERYEDVVRRNAEAVTRRLSGFGLGHAWISIANLAGGTPGRWTEWNYDRFPSGPDQLRRTLEQHGLKWGLWCGPYWVCTLAAEQLQMLQGALLTGPDGEPLVARAEWQFGDAGEMAKEDRPCIYALDPSHPKTQAFLKETFETYRRWGVRYYMIDFLQAGSGNISRFVYSRHHDKNLVAGPEVYHAGLSVIRKAAGDDTYLLTSSGPSVHNTGFADGIRTGNDFGEGRALYKDSYFYPATFVINSTGFWTGAQHALQNQAAAYYTHRKLYINDSGNVLTVDKPIALSDARIHATIHAMSGGPSMIGDDLDRIDEQRLALIKATLPRPRDVARPLDLFTSAHPDSPKLFHRRVDRPWGRFDVIAVYNFSEDLLRENVDLHRLGLPPGREYVLFEFWNGEYLGRVSESFTASVPPKEVKVYRLAESGVPVIAGTDMHLLMGEMEILDCRWDEGELTLSGHAIRPEGEEGSIYVHVPERLRVAEPEGLWIAKDARDRDLIVRTRLSFTGGPAPFRMSFCPLDSSEDTMHRSDWDRRV